MDDDRDHAELARILEPFRRLQIETGPVVLTAEYLRMLEEVESAPENQSGTDKTWVETAQRQYRGYFSRVAREN